MGPDLLPPVLLAGDFEPFLLLLLPDPLDLLVADGPMPGIDSDIMFLPPALFVLVFAFGA